MTKGAGGWTAVVLLAAVAIAGAAGLRWALARGIGLSPDSASYIDCAINLARGEGYNSAFYRYFRPIPAGDYVREAVSPGGVKPLPQIYFLPAYPSVLALLIGAGVRPEEAALWLGVILFGLNAFIVGLIVRGLARGSLFYAVGSALVLMGSESMLSGHSRALSEPLFIFLCLAGLWLLSRYLEKGGPVFLFAAGVVCGLAFLTRYPGAALVGAGLMGLVLFVGRPLPGRLSQALTFMALSCFPIAAFFLWRVLSAGGAPVNLPHLQPQSAGALGKALSGLGSWILPGSSRIVLFPGQKVILSTIAAAALLGITAACAAAGLRHGRVGDTNGRVSRCRSLFLFAVFIPAYLVLFLVVDALLRGFLLPDIRLLSPMFPPFLIVAASYLKERVGSLPDGRFKRVVSVGLAAYVLVYAGCGVYWMSVCRREGRGYNNRAFQASDVVRGIARVRALGDVPIFTNDSGAIYFQAGRYAYQFPSRNGTQDPEVIAEAVGEHPACFVYYWTPAHMKALGGGGSRDGFERSLIEALGLQTLVRSETITVLWRPGRS